VFVDTGLYTNGYRSAGTGRHRRVDRDRPFLPPTSVADPPAVSPGEPTVFSPDRTRPKHPRRFGPDIGLYFVQEMGQKINFVKKYREY